MSAVQWNRSVKGRVKGGVTGGVNGRFGLAQGGGLRGPMGPNEHPDLEAVLVLLLSATFLGFPGEPSLRNG